MSDPSRRIANLLGRGVVLSADSARKMQSLQLRLLSGETKDRVEHFEPYGYTARPLPGAEHLTVFLDGDRSHGVTVVVADRRYRLQALPAGGVALFDCADSSVILSADGRIKLTAPVMVEIDAPMVEITHSLHVGEHIVADGDISDQGGGKSMAQGREVYNDHDHPLPGGATSGNPNQQQ